MMCCSDTRPADGCESPISIFIVPATDRQSSYKEQQRLTDRERAFSVVGLQRLAAMAMSRKFEDIISIDKLGEGAANRAFVIRFRGDFKLVARIPYPITNPPHLVVASEAATLIFLRSKGIPVPGI